MQNGSERCCGCGRPLPVPPQAVAIRCPACQAETRVRPEGPNDLVVQVPAGGRFCNVVNMEAPGPGGHGFVDGNGFGPRPALPLPPAYGRKRALLIGINYYSLPLQHQRKGSMNDVKRMRSLLVQKLGFPNDCIITLTEEERNPQRIPTKQNMRAAMRWLVKNCQPGDSLVFHFSGHAKRQRDYNKDEIDGFDEALCPLDYEREGLIIDDEINEIMVRPLLQGAKLHAIVDTSFSGTVLDLPYVCRMNREGYYFWEDQRTRIYKGTSGGLALCLSACDDHRKSGSTKALTGAFTGALTLSFTQAIQNDPGLTYGRLLNAMRIVIPFLIPNNKHGVQEPQLSSSEKFDIYSKQVIL